jgi:hypothetical protein
MKKLQLRNLWPVLGRIAVKAGCFIGMMIPLAAVGFLMVFAVNLLFPSFIDKVGENTTLKYSLVTLGLILVATVIFVWWMLARRRDGKPVSWLLAGGYAGLVLGMAFPVVYMIMRAASDYILPENPYWG